MNRYDHSADELKGLRRDLGAAEEARAGRRELSAPERATLEADLRTLVAMVDRRLERSRG